ncbi:MAG TPA: FKBP-type peptidyl-prolyl cis-trans isomerase [Vicinamibacterales bacterium]|jgi:FKBP-type peptidyl-prolyl cis-trans isomerase FkpA
MVHVRRWSLSTALLTIGLFFVSCTETPTTPTNSAPFSQTDLVVGTGATASTGATLSVDYTGWLYDSTKSDNKGLQFDSSIGKAPFSFILGNGDVIKGWDQGVAGMRVGGVRRLVVPPSLAYGDTRSGPIPPNSTLVFDITLLSAGT